MKIYIASSWKNQHAVELLTEKIRERGHEVVSWIENCFGEPQSDFDTWVNSDASNQAFEYDTHGAMTCDLFIYIGPAGKDAAAECGMAYGQRYKGKTIPMIGLYAKGEDFGLMRKMFDVWCSRYTEVIAEVHKWEVALEWRPEAKNSSIENQQS